MQSIHLVFEYEDSTSADVEHEVEDLLAHDAMLPLQLVELWVVLLASHQALEFALPQRGELTDILHRHISGKSFIDFGLLVVEVVFQHFEEGETTHQLVDLIAIIALGEALHLLRSFWLAPSRLEHLQEGHPLCNFVSDCELVEVEEISQALPLVMSSDQPLQLA